MARISTAQRLDHFRLGLLLAVGSAFAFGSSGPFAKSLMEAGWSPTAAVTARLAGGALRDGRSSPPSSGPTGSARPCSMPRPSSPTA